MVVGVVDIVETLRHHFEEQRAKEGFTLGLDSQSQGLGPPTARYQFGIAIPFGQSRIALLKKLHTTSGPVHKEWFRHGQ